MPFELRIWELQTCKRDVLTNVVTVFVGNRGIFLTSRKRGTFKGEIFAYENQDAATVNGEAELVSQDIKLFKTDGIVKDVHLLQ